MERLIYVPIERLEERYSSQWDDWFQAAFKRENIPYRRVGDLEEHKIRDGQFLDIFETNRFKNLQLHDILVELYATLQSGSSCTIFFMDLWFPGIEMLAYIRDGLGVKDRVKICGMLHAGTYDPHDFLAQKGMARWGRHFESALLHFVDEVYIATDFHKHLLRRAGLPTDTCQIVEWPVETDFPEKSKAECVVFPHRLASEKQPELFAALAHMYSNKYDNSVKWIRTKDVCRDKRDYYSVLSHAKVAVSTALQETYGIAMVEAVNNGCIPVAPNRLSYPEVLKGFKLYNSLEEAVDLIHDALVNYSRPKPISGKDLQWVKRLL